MPQVSIIVLTYHPDREKLLRTLCAAAAQNIPKLEIIVSDDGTPDADFSWLPDFFQAHGIRNYKILQNPRNKGTVQNCLSAVRAARGKYVFLTSPGDLLFDENVLADFWRFAEENRCDACFGNALFYSAEGSPRLTREVCSPPRPRLYAPGTAPATRKAAFFGGDWIIGAVYFRSREFALTYLEAISDTSVYMEDTTSTAFALADGRDLLYFDRNMVWYEDGTGMSTGKSELWKTRLDTDLTKSFTKLKKLHPVDPFVDIALCNMTEKHAAKRIMIKLLRHPLAMLRILRARKACPSQFIRCTDGDLERLRLLLAQKND